MVRKRRKRSVEIEGAGFVSPKIRPRKLPKYVIAELRHDSRIAYESTGFAGPATVEKTFKELNQILSKFHVKRIESHFGMRTRQIRKHSTEAPSTLKQKVTAEFAQAGFIRITPRAAKDGDSLVKHLNKSKAVWKAVLPPELVAAAAATGTSTASRNFEPSQGYLHSAPNGIAAMQAWAKFRAHGRGVTICDIEGNWNFTHEDLPRIRHIGGTLINNLGWRNHGTAVLGEMLSQPNRFGTVGISHRARGFVQSFIVGGIDNPAAAIVNATAKLKKGDIILIELQARSPLTGNYIALQYWGDIASAIRAAVDKGITVVEAAGNGNENFNLPIYNNSGLQKDYGAIVVGAGIPPTNHFDYFGPDYGFGRYEWIGNPRSRIWFSNYGKIVNVQAWGWHVTSCGYGDAQGGPDENRWYTLRFSGTSSASPIVTGAAACIQSRALAKYNKPLLPKKLRALLIKTGTPQVAGPRPLSERIGPQPNLLKALAMV